MLALCCAAQPHGTPQLLQEARTAGITKGGDPGCTAEIVQDNSFEVGAPGSPWLGYSDNYGSPICHTDCSNDVGNGANVGLSWIRFINNDENFELAYVRQEVTMPASGAAYLRFYVRASTASVNSVLQVSIGKDALVTLDKEDLAAYTDYVPLVFDVSDYADGGQYSIFIQASLPDGPPSFIYVDDICIEPIGGGGEGEGETCHTLCAEGGADQDGDGLSDACEECAGSSPAIADTDDDGMDDGFEYQRALQPGSASDARVDLDGDGLTNIEEYYRDTNPLDINDPYAVRFVSPNGLDVPEGGLPGSPWQTIAYAVSKIPATLARPGVIVLLPGTYAEDVALKPFLTLRASTALGARIQGSVTGAEECALDGLRFAPISDAPMLQIDNVRMTIQGCQFTPVEGTATGVLLQGAGSAGTVIAGCLFDGCGVAIDVDGPLPLLRSCKIMNWSEAGLSVNDDDDDDDKAALEDGGIGDVTNPSVGFNQFIDGAGGPAVRNARPETLRCEQNYWGTDNREAIQNQIEGAADFEPFFASAAILASGIFCTVIDGSDQTRVTEAAVSLAPSAYPALTQNANGVYGFSAVPEGSYTVRATADGFATATRQVSVGPGELASIVLILGAPGPAPTCGCNAAKNGLPGPGDVLITLSAPVALLLMGLYARRAV